METKMHILQATKSTCNYERLYEENPPPNSSFFSKAYMHRTTSYAAHINFEGYHCQIVIMRKSWEAATTASLSSKNLTMLCLSYILTENSREKTLLF